MQTKGPKVEDIISNSILNQHSIFILLFFSPLNPNSSTKQWILGSPPPVQATEPLLVKKVLGSHKQPRVQSSVVLSIAQSASHRGDEGGSFAAAVFRKQECHVAFGRQLLYRLVHDLWKAAESREGVKSPSSTQLKMAPSSKYAGGGRVGFTWLAAGGRKANICPVAGAVVHEKPCSFQSATMSLMYKSSRASVATQHPPSCWFQINCWMPR